MSLLVIFVSVTIAVRLSMPLMNWLIVTSSRLHPSAGLSNEMPYAVLGSKPVSVTPVREMSSTEVAPLSVLIAPIPPVARELTVRSVNVVPSESSPRMNSLWLTLPAVGPTIVPDSDSPTKFSCSSTARFVSG